MAGFMSPSILFLSTWDKPERDYCSVLLQRLRRAGYEKYHEPSVGGFAMPLVARDVGWPAESMVTSDTHLFTSLIGEIHSGNDFSRLDIQIDDEPIEWESDDPVERAAQAIWEQYRLRMEVRAEGAYWALLLEDVKANAEQHRLQIKEQLQGQVSRLRGLDYRPMSMWEHLEMVADDPKAVVISNPPTYKSAYERFFDTKGRMTWNTPDYEVFDAPVDIPRMVEVMDGRAALLVVQQQQTPRNAANESPAYARQLSANQLVYVNSNRPDEVRGLMGGNRIVTRKVAAFGEKPYPEIPNDYVIAPDAKIQLLNIETKVAEAYKDKWVHRLVTAPGSSNILVLVDGYAAGVIGYSLATVQSSYSLKWADHAMLRFAFGAPHLSYRLTRLATLIAVQQSTLWMTATPKSSMAVAMTEGIVTVEMTRHPEAKGLRGIMKLDERQKHPDGYKLVYATPWHEEKSTEETLAEWLTKEKKWSALKK